MGRSPERGRVAPGFTEQAAERLGARVGEQDARLTSSAEAIPTTSPLQQNLLALAATDPALAGLLERTPARMDVSFAPSAVGGEAEPTAVIEEWGMQGVIQRALASRRDPMLEARRLVERIDIREHAAVVVTGFGLGYHVAELARRMGKTGVLFVFEPDLALLRAVFERIDCSAWLRGSNVIFLTDPADDAAMAARCEGLEGVLAMGLAVLEHPPSQPRLGEQAISFITRFTRVFQAVRTTVITTMVQTDATLRNLTQNLDLYATAGGIKTLRDRLKGRPAIVVSAGPSLERNIEQLARPGVAERFCIIAVQTVLKPLLARGIRPHFVTALDFHQISRRFYEGLTAEGVDGVTLVVEPKVNPAVPLAWPGAVRCSSDPFLDRLLGPELAPAHGEIASGATVAHLAYYLARHMGCDPVVLVGQDLGFTDGQYYSANAAIHNVWAGELNEFNTLEMLEWERIVRMRPLLRRLQDQQGRPIYTDEQMNAYLVQFQREFQADAGRGLSVIDATEGGVSKAGATASTLREVVDRVLMMPVSEPVGERLASADDLLKRRGDDPQKRRALRAVCERLREVRQSVWSVAKLSTETAGLLGQMLEHHQDQARVNTLIGRVDGIRDRVLAMDPAFGLVQHLNQTGGFNRARADRKIMLAMENRELTPLDEQRQRIERDKRNVEWLADAADALGTILDEAAVAAGGGAKRTREPTVQGEQLEHAGAVRTPFRGRLAALVSFDHERSGLGIERDLDRPLIGGRSAVRLTLERLGRCRRLDAVIVLARDVEAARRAVRGINLPMPMHIEQADDPVAFDHRTMRAARLLAADGWRGGLGNFSVYDEALWPAAGAAALARHEFDAGMIVGADWSLVDPALCDKVLDRYREDPQVHRFTFSQAAPGLAGCVLDRESLSQLAAGRANAGSFASIGGMLGYVPTTPLMDLIAKSMCVEVSPAVRDGVVRCVLDSPKQAEIVLRALQNAGLDPATADAERITAALRAAAEAGELTQPRHLRVQVLDADGRAIDAERLRLELGRWQPALGEMAVTLEAAPGRETLDHPEWDRLAEMVRGAGAGLLHVRTGLRTRMAGVERLLTIDPEIVSVDLVAEDAATYAALTGLDVYAAVRENFGRLLSGRRAAPGGVFSPWVVPRLTRCDAVYGQIESFFDRHLLGLGWAVIDPLPAARAGERIGPLPLPALANLRRGIKEVRITPGGAGE